MSRTQAPPEPGVVGRYALCGEIASGGMATVFFGRLLGARGFSRTVAIKRLHPAYAKDPDFASMFLDEARMAARIRHPNVVQTLDVVSANGELLLVMDYVHGESLSGLNRALRVRQRLVPRRIAAAILCNVLLGLHAAHQATNDRGEPLELVHRDVSPQNILVGADGVARLLDFGIAKAAGRAHTTRDGAVKGKYAYMAPEQVVGAPVTRAADIFSAGVVLWELLTGQRLFYVEGDATTLMNVLHAQVDPPSSRVPSIPTAFDDVVMRAMRRSALERFATAREMAVALEGCEGLASMTEVGEWVESLAAETLRARADHLARVEAMGLDEPPPSVGQRVVDLTRRAASPGAEAAGPDQTRVAASFTNAPAKPNWRRRLFSGIAFGFAGAIGLSAAYRWELGARRAQAPAIAESVTAQGADAPPAAPEPVRSLVPPPPPVVAPSATQAVSAVPSAASARPHPPAPVRPARPAPADCDPPYTIDADGHRHYKKNCL
jgi:serine/threonine-protein kinase